MTRPVVERTLFVTRYHPVPAHTGTLQYSAQLIAILAELSDRLDVLCQSDPRRDMAADPNGPEFPDNVAFFVQPPAKPSLAERVASPLPHSAITHATADNRRRLGELLRQRPTCVVLDHIASAWAYRQVAAYKARHPEVRVVYCTHNMERDTRLSLLAASWRRPAWLIGSLIDVIRIDRTDRRLARLADLLTCISSADARRHIARYRPRHTAVVRPTYRGRVRANRTIDADVPKRICIVGSFISSTKKSNLSAFLTEGYELFAALAAAAAAVLFGAEILTLFGPTFSAGHTALVILVFGHLVRAGTGLVGDLLGLTGHQKLNAWVLALSAVLNVILNALLIPRYGIAGAAAATAVSMAFWNVGLWLLGRRKLGVDTSIIYALRRLRHAPVPAS
jgi:hypothetical protein